MNNGSANGIAVVGLGPRGLGAMESLAARLAGDRPPLAVDVFDPSDAPGAGPNFDPSESPYCRLNIPLRDVDIRPPKSGSCGRFADWLPGPADPDEFPARADLGRYLEARLQDLRRNPALSLRFQAIRVDAAERGAQGWMLRAGGSWHGPYSEVLLTVGQPEVRPDDQLAGWQDHARQSSAVLVSAYPARVLQDRVASWSGRTVAVRGLALSAFDVLRELTVAQGGRFENGRYRASGREPARILPFSLDGKPPFPKPETAALDARFDPTAAETAAFLAQMRQAARATPGEARDLVSAALLPVLARVLEVTGGGADTRTLTTWLDTEWDAPGTQEGAPPVEVLHHGIEMADGRRPPGIGYTVGQIWRKWQDQLRQGYNPSATPPETAKMLVGFDEGLKRFSYGPPVSSARELAALIEADLVDLGFAADPEIATTGTGWSLQANGRGATAEVMVDAVLPSADLSGVTDPLVAGLVEAGLLRPLADGLGADTGPDGTIAGGPGTGMAFLGRLALGSVIAVDSLHDCFGEASHRWAEGAMERFRVAEGDAGQYA